MRNKVGVRRVSQVRKQICLTLSLNFPSPPMFDPLFMNAFAKGAAPKGELDSLFIPSIVEFQIPAGSAGDLGYIGRHGIGLSGSYQQGYSTTYNAQSHIKVVCNGYILAHISNYIAWGHPQILPSMGRSPPCMTRGQRPICVLVTHARVNIAAFWHGF